MPVLPTASRAPRMQQQEQDLWAGEQSELKILPAESKNPSRGLQSGGLSFFKLEQYTISIMSIGTGLLLVVLGI